MNNFYRGYSPNPDATPYGYVPPFNNLSIAINFTDCSITQKGQRNIYVLLENHLVNTHLSAIGDTGWTGSLTDEAQAFLDTIAPNAVVTSIFNDGYVK